MLLLRALTWNVYKYKRKLLDNRKCYFNCTRDISLKVLFFGADTFSLPSLRILHDKTRLVSCLGIVTSMKNPANCVRKYAEDHTLPIYPWPLRPEQCSSFDLGVVVSFGHLIPERIIESFPLGIINVHASLLPRWRGAAPIIYAIMNNDTITGVSIMKIAPKSFDIGEILAQKSIIIPPGIFMPTLHTQLANAGASLLCDVINGYPKSFQNSYKQDNDLATYAPKITNALIEVDWSTLTAEEIHNRYRALFGFKNLSTKWNNKTLYLLDIRVPEVRENSPSSIITLEPGYIRFQKNNNSLLVTCAKETSIEIHKVRMEGRKPMTALQFYNGFLSQMRNSRVIFDRKVGEQ